MNGKIHKVIPYIGTKIIFLPLFSHNSTQKAPPDEISIMYCTTFCVDYESAAKITF